MSVRRLLLSLTKIIGDAREAGFGRHQGGVERQTRAGVGIVASEAADALFGEIGTLRGVEAALTQAGRGDGGRDVALDQLALRAANAGEFGAVFGMVVRRVQDG